MQLLRQQESERYRSRKEVHRARSMSRPHGAQVTERCRRTLGPRPGAGEGTETPLGRGRALLPTRGSLAAETGPKLEVRTAGRRARPGRATGSRQIERTLPSAQSVPRSPTFQRDGRARLPASDRNSDRDVWPERSGIGSCLLCHHTLVPPDSASFMDRVNR